MVGTIRTLLTKTDGFVPVEGGDWFVPDSVSMLIEQEFVTRCMAMHSSTPFQKMNDMDMTPMTNAEADAMLRQFYQSKVIRRTRWQNQFGY